MEERAEDKDAEGAVTSEKKDLGSSELGFWSPTLEWFPLYLLPHLLFPSSMTNGFDPSSTRPTISQASVIVSFRPSMGQMALSTGGPALRQPHDSRKWPKAGFRNTPTAHFLLLFFPFPFPCLMTVNYLNCYLSSHSLGCLFQALSDGNYGAMIKWQCRVLETFPERVHHMTASQERSLQRVFSQNKYSAITPIPLVEWPLEMPKWTFKSEYEKHDYYTIHLFSKLHGCLLVV